MSKPSQATMEIAENRVDRALKILVDKGLTREEILEVTSAITDYASQIVKQELSY